MSSGVIVSPNAFNSIPGSLEAGMAGSKPLTTGFNASTVRPICRKCRMSAAVT